MVEAPGVSARALSDAGFRHLDIVDLNESIIGLADRYFQNVNHGVRQRPGVETHITDGRNFLLVEPRAYDVISIEITSIWFAGAASLYNVEFYDLVKTRLKPSGVLQQWVQLHQIRGTDLLTILGSARARFPFVSLYYVGTHGVLIASEAPSEPRPESFTAFDQHPPSAAMLALYGGDAASLAARRLLGPPEVDRLLARYAAQGAELLSTDDDLSLGYSTPRGNVRDHEESTQQNLAFLRGL